MCALIETNIKGPSTAQAIGGPAVALSAPAACCAAGSPARPSAARPGGLVSSWPALIPHTAATLAQTHALHPGPPEAQFRSAQVLAAYFRPAAADLAGRRKCPPALLPRALSLSFGALGAQTPEQLLRRWTV